jgi:hypothetical protein
MGKPTVIPNQTSAAAGTRITVVASGDITPAYWLDDGINPLTAATNGEIVIPSITAGGVGSGTKFVAQKQISTAGGSLKYPIHQSQVTSVGLLTNHAGLAWQAKMWDAQSRTVVGWNFYATVSPQQWIIDVFDEYTTLYRHTQTFPFSQGKIIEVVWDAGYIYTYYDGNFLYGNAHSFTPVWPLVPRFVCYYSGSLTVTPGGGFSEFRFSAPELSGTWALVHMPISTNMSLTCHDAAGGLILDSENTAALNSRAWAQQVSGAPEMKFTMPAGVTVKKVRVFYNANVNQILGKSDYVEILATGGASAPLAIVAPTPPVTLQPGASVSVVCNYPSNELTYVAGGGGGSFSGSTYTASLNAGNAYTMQVTRAASSETVQQNVSVPAKLTPASASLVGLTPQSFTTNADVSNFATTGWTTDGGTLSAQAVRGVTYTAPTSVGTYHVYAQTAFGQLVANITVTASGGTTTTGFRLLPAAGFAVEVGAQVTVDAVTDFFPLIWATLENLRIDGANNNVIILDNAAIARAWIANAFGTEGGTFEWALGQYFAPNSSSDNYKVGWAVQSAATGFSIQTPLTEFYFQATGVNTLDFVVTRNALVVLRSPITFDTQLAARVVIPNPYTGFWQIWLRTGGVWNMVVEFAGSAEPRGVRLTYAPRLFSFPSNQTPIAWPVLTGRWERFYPPNWTALLLNAQGQTIGTLPLSTLESPGASGPNESFPQQARVTANAAGQGRVSAQYPSGLTASNVVPIQIAQTAAPLDVIFPATSPVTLNPNETITVEANYAKELLTYFASGGGSFASFPPENKNVYTAHARAGSGPYFDVRKGSEQVRTFVIIRTTLDPSSSFADPGGTVYLTLNTDAATGVTVGASGGTVSLGAFLGSGLRQVVYTAPLTAGTFTITADTPTGTATATVTVQTQAPINITNENAEVEPASQTLINTNYPPAEVTFSVSPQAGSFTGAVWTAPNTAGRYTITASRPGAGSDTVLLIVPLRITPKNPAAIAQGGQIQFTANFTPVAWQVVPGTGTVTQAGLYTAPLSSGQYGVSVQGTVGGVSQGDSALVTVSGDALAIQGPTTVTLQPNEQYRVLVNYPLSEVLFTAVAPGVFGLQGGPDENLYTAPAGAGSYTAYVSRGNQSITMTFIVPVVLTPSAITLGNGELQVFSVNADVPAFATTGWMATGGTLSSQAIRTVQYAAGSTGGTFGITAVTNQGTVSAVITLTGAAGGAFSITYPADPVTLNPGSSITLGFNTPYEPSIVLSANGGTFAGAVYTAPQQAGTYVITATRDAVTDTLTVNIPLVVAPAAIVCGPGARTLLSVNHPTPSFQVQPGAGAMDGLTFVASFTVQSWSQGIIVTAPGGLQVVVAVVIQSVQLVVYGPQTLTLASGQSYVVSTNVPPQAATYTAFGGSFTNTNVYVAPDAAGNYYFTVSYEGQSVQVNVIVPLRIEPDVVRLSAGQSFQFSVNAPSATWSTTDGTIDPVTGFYTAPLEGTVATVTATTPTSSDTAQVLLLEEFPFPASYAIEGSQARDAIIVKVEDGRRHGRAQGEPFKSYDLHFDNREQAELEAVLTWHKDRYPERPFLFNDADLSLYVAVVFDSDVRWQDLGECRFNYAFRCLETP